MSDPVLYVPQPGTLPAAAIRVMADWSGPPLATVPLMELCGQTAMSAPDFVDCMAECRSHSLVCAEYSMDKGVTTWTLTDKGLQAACELMRRESVAAKVPKNKRAKAGAESASDAVAKPEVEGAKVAARPDDIPVFLASSPSADVRIDADGTAADTFNEPGEFDEFWPLPPAAMQRIDQPAPPDGDNFECALTSAGRLVIHADGKQFALTAEQTTALFAHTDKARGIEWEGGA